MLSLALSLYSFSLFVWDSVNANITSFFYLDHIFTIVIAVYSICIEVLFINVSLSTERPRSTDFLNLTQATPSIGWYIGTTNLLLKNIVGQSTITKRTGNATFIRRY